jgi:hypothetical protein
MGEPDLYDVLLAGDLNPALRALLPAAVRSALEHYPEPLLRLALLANGYIPSLPAGPVNAEAEQTAKEEEDNALYSDTTCEDTVFPWQRAAAPEHRLGEALGALHAIPEPDFYPFDSATALLVGPVLQCDAWPYTTAPASSTGALPNVPTLILSGEQDLRTPTSNARALAAEIPDAQLLLVPYTGHSVIGSDLSSCAATAVEQFFTVGSIQPCASTPNLFAPTSLSPTKLTYIKPPHELAGRPGKTLVAALDTLTDFSRLVIAATLQANEQLPSGSSFGGLRGGYAKLTHSAAILKGFSLVPGVQLTATFPIRDDKLQAADIHVSGKEAAPGTIIFGGASTRATGTLGSKRFDIAVANGRPARTGTTEWPSLTALDAQLPLRRLAAGAGGPSLPTRLR